MSGSLINAMTSHYKDQVDSGKRVKDQRIRRESQRLPSIGKPGRSQDSTSIKDLKRVASGTKAGSVDLLQPDFAAGVTGFNRSRTAMGDILPDFD
jgi:hypothetical protein